MYRHILEMMLVFTNSLFEKGALTGARSFHFFAFVGNLTLPDWSSECHFFGKRFILTRGG